jgi:hypothetical protein
MLTYYVDIDGTICVLPSPGDYENAKPVSGWIDKINALYDAGNEIIYWTSRGVVTGDPWYTVTKRQLYEWGCKHHDLKMDKPQFDHMIDDKSSRIEELPKPEHIYSIKKSVHICNWYYDDQTDCWSTSCGHEYTINEGSPEENDMCFCTFCGGKLKNAS